MPTETVFKSVGAGIQITSSAWFTLPPNKGVLFVQGVSDVSAIYGQPKFHFFNSVGVTLETQYCATFGEFKTIEHLAITETATNGQLFGNGTNNNLKGWYIPIKTAAIAINDSTAALQYPIVYPIN